MVGDATQRLVVGIVGLVWGLFGGVGRLDNDIGGVLGESTQVGDILGVFGEYLGRLYFEAKQRPLFLVSDVVASPDLAED